MESVKKWLNERAVKKNGLYVHYNPPKVVGGVSAAQLRQWARGGTDSTLERAVLAGQGRRLLAEADCLLLSQHMTTLVAKCDALHSAVERGSLLELQELLESEYNRRKYVTCRDEAGVGLLHKAVYCDFMDIVEYLVKNYPLLVHQKDSEGRTALHYAAMCRDEASVAALLEGAGAARGVRDASGRTPANYRGVGRTLLTLPTTTDDMARENAKNTPGLVIKRHNIRIWCHDCDMARLQRVVWEGHGARLLSEVSNQMVVKRFLEAVPYIMNTIRDTHIAVVQNNLEDVMKLSSDPVPPQILSSRDANNMTCMHKAAGLGHVSIMKYIAERYPQGINDVDNDGRTPLHYAAAMRDDQHTYNTLVSLGADESAVDNKNRTPGYYVNRYQEIDKNHLKTVPEAPRTASSAYPTSWDWKLLENDVIADLNKKSRRRNLKASTENLSSKSNTKTLSDNIGNYTNIMKASSTHELIKDLPELDESNKLNTDIATFEPEIENNKEQLNIKADTTLVEEQQDNHCERNSDESQNKSNHDEENTESHTEIRNENYNPLHQINEIEVAIKDENEKENFHPHENNLEYKATEHNESHAEYENEDSNREVHQSEVMDESKGENYHDEGSTRESAITQVELLTDHVPKELENIDCSNQESTETMEISPESNTENQETSTVKITPIEDLPKDENELEPKQYISFVENSSGLIKNSVEEAEEASGLQQVTTNEQEQVLAIEDISRIRATSGKENVTEQSLLQNNIEEEDIQNLNVVDKDETQSTMVQSTEEDIDDIKGKEPQLQKECIIINDTFQEDITEANKYNLSICDVAENNNIGYDINFIKQKGILNYSTILNHQSTQDTEQIVNNTTESRINIGQREDDDDVHVQGDNSSEYNDLNHINTPELSNSGSAKRDKREISSGNVNSGRNTQESLLEKVHSKKKDDSSYTSFTEREELQREVFVFDNEIDPEVTDLINKANMEMLAALVLNGEGSRLIGRGSENTELQSFLDSVPIYMQKINKVHLAAKEGNIKDLQAALDRRKFAIARDPISPNGTTPLHIATIFGKTNIMKYLGGRFPETLSAVDFEGRTALHYAAVLPDNGHYYTLLQQLGANSKDLDDNGKSAEEYYKNPSLLPFDQLLSDFGISEDAVKSMFSDKVPQDRVSARRVLDAPDALDTLERCYRLLASARPSRTPLSASSNNGIPPLVLGRFLKRPIFEIVKYRITKLDHDLFDVIWPAVKKLPDSKNIVQTVEEDFPGGITAPDYYVYDVFNEFLTPLIKDLHNINIHSDLSKHPKSDFIRTVVKKLSHEPLVELNIDPNDVFVLSGTVECSRNIKGCELPINLKVSQLETIERVLTNLLLHEEFTKLSEHSNPESDQKGGVYYTLNEVLEKPSELCATLASNGLLVAICDKEEIDDGTRLHGKHWPYGRGVFVSEDKTVAIWVNVHDHVRVILSTLLESPGEIGLAFSKMTRIMTYLHEHIEFVWHDKLGHLSSRPTFLGSGIRFSLIVNFPGLTKDIDNMKHLCAMRGLQYRETLNSDIARISNYQSLGLTETNCFNDFATAISNLLHLENELSMQNSAHLTTLLSNMFRRNKSSLPELESEKKNDK